MAEGTIVPHRVKFTHPAPDRLAVAIGGWWPTLFGAIFFLPGLVMMLLGFHFVPVSGENFMVNGIPVLGLFGVPFFLIGGSLICYYRWLTFDLRRRSLALAAGWLLPMFRRERSLQEFTSVTIRYQVQYTSGSEGGGSAEYYAVVLTAEDRKKDLSFNNCTTFQEAYAQAATLAQFLSLPVQDLSTYHALEITPADLDHPLQARLRAVAAQPQLAAPASLRSQVEASPDGVRISISGKTSLWNSLAPLLIIAAMIIFVLILRTTDQAPHAPAVFQYWTLGLVGLFGGIPVLVMLKNNRDARRTYTVVSVDSRHVTIEEHRGRRVRNTIALSVADILDIDYGVTDDRQRPKVRSGGIFSAEGIKLKTKTGLYTLGAGLPDAEVEYLAQVVEKALSPILQPEKL